MSSSNGSPTHSIDRMPKNTHDTDEFITMDQLQHLIHVLDQSDTVEVEVRDAEHNARLVLRKINPSEERNVEIKIVPEEDANHAEIMQQIIKSAFVGTFHLRSHSKELPRIAVGDYVKAGQHLGNIQSLNILNDVETSVPGRVAMVMVDEGQIVEFGQPLFMIDTK